MRIRIHLHQPKDAVLPFHHQYELSSWIYRVLAQGNTQFAHWLHNQGFRRQHQNFKFFTCSTLRQRGQKQAGDRLLISSGNCHLDLSFLLPETAQYFINGLFQGRYLELGDQHSQASFRITHVESLPEPEWKEQMQYQLQTPALVKKTWAEGNQRRLRYLSPVEAGFESRFLNNLVHKYCTFLQSQHGQQETWPPEMYCSPSEMEHWDSNLRFNLISKVNRRSVKIKANTRHETLLHGFQFAFALHAPVCLHKIAYYSGIGSNNAMGFGCISTTVEGQLPQTRTIHAQAS